MQSVLAISCLLAAFLCVAFGQGWGWNPPPPSWDNRGPSNWNNGGNNGGRNGGSLTDRIFYYENGQVSSRCGTGTDNNWYQYTWTSGGIRTNYYENQGRARNIDQCMRICDRNPDCYFATITASSTCYTLSTSNTNTCRYLKWGHFGPIGERCTSTQSCPSAYKVCREPRCTLYSIMQEYCKKNDVNQGVNSCKYGI